MRPTLDWLQLLNERWERLALRQLLEPDETLVWVDVAATGILGRPWLNSVPAMWGSTFWDVALTDRRLLAAELPLITVWKRRWKVYSVPWSDVTGAELLFYTSATAAILSISAPRSAMKFKMFRMAFDFAGGERALRIVMRDVVVRTGFFRPKI